MRRHETIWHILKTHNVFVSVDDMAHSSLFIALVMVPAQGVVVRRPVPWPLWWAKMAKSGAG